MYNLEITVHKTKIIKEFVFNNSETCFYEPYVLLKYIFNKNTHILLLKTEKIK